MKLKPELFIILSIVVDSILKIYFKNNFHIIFKLLPYVFILTWYFNNKVGHFRQSDLWVLFSFFFTILGEILFLYRDAEIILLLILFCYIIEHQIYIYLLRQNKEINKLNKNEVILKKGWPYLLLGFLFFGILLKNSVPDSYYVFVIIYVFQFSILGAFSLIQNKNNSSRKYIIIGIALNVLSDCLSSYMLFINSFYLDYLLIRFTFIFSKLFLIKGFVYSFKKADSKVFSQ